MWVVKTPIIFVSKLLREQLLARSIIREERQDFHKSVSSGLVILTRTYVLMSTVRIFY
jgi:hypothetical protein